MLLTKCLISGKVVKSEYLAHIKLSIKLMLGIIICGAIFSHVSKGNTTAVEVEDKAEHSLFISITPQLLMCE